MNKKFFVSGIVVLIVIGYSVFIWQRGDNSAVVSPSNNQRTESIKVPIDNPLSGELKSFSNVTPITFTNKANNVAISFSGAVGEARNPGSYLFLNGEKVGQVQGAGVLYHEFSSDGKYFGFVSTGICGATCSHFYIYIVDVPNHKLALLQSPRTQKDYVGVKAKLGYEANPTIGSLSWNSPNKLEVLFYFAAFDSDAGSRYYRVSPKEVWEYNMDTQKYTLLKTLAE